MPKQPVKSAARFTKTGGNIFLIFSVFIFGAVAVGAIGVFAYGEYQKGIEKTKAAELEAAEKSVNASAVEDFIRARDRFKAAGAVLDTHVAISNFFDLLESMTLVSVRYSSFTFGTLEDGTAEITLSGTARSFNALAAQSAAFSREKEIRRAIFSGIQVAENGTVSFDIEAQLDADLLRFSVSSPRDGVPSGVPGAGAPLPATTSPASSATSSARSAAPQEGSVTPPQP